MLRPKYRLMGGRKRMGGSLRPLLVYQTTRGALEVSHVETYATLGQEKLGCLHSRNPSGLSTAFLSKTIG